MSMSDTATFSAKDYIEYQMADGTIVLEDVGGDYIDTGDALVPITVAEEMGMVIRWLWTPTGYVADAR